jgi:ABC-type transport system substrate-binding protein
MSPALAFTFVERQVVDLLFEPLVQPVAGGTYESRLAERLPRISPRRREFRIRADARWPDGQPVTSTDVRNMVLKLRGDGWRGRSGLWNYASLEAQIDEDDPAVVRLSFNRGMVEPLSLMNYHVLPQHFRKQPLKLDDLEFAKAPFGSGPYLAPQRVTEDNRDYLVFKVNPHFRRHGKSPRFAEIRLFTVKKEEVTKEFQHPTKPMNFWLDAPSEALALCDKAQAKSETLVNRRIYFLAVNCRLKDLASVDLRRAIALAIDREAILKSRFRAGDAKRHAALNGPYPAESWACAKGVPTNLFNSELAKSKLKGSVTLALKFPDDDPRVGEACKDIQKQLERLGKGRIKLELQGMKPSELKDAVDRRDYQLAYFHVDYSDDTYPLWPFFEEGEAMAKGGANFLGYDMDGKLLTLIDDLRGTRQFGAMKGAAHGIHSHLFDQMPFIPLWQLDTHIAYRGVRPRDLDGDHIFANITQWEPDPR